MKNAMPAFVILAAMLMTTCADSGGEDTNTQEKTLTVSGQEEADTSNETQTEEEIWMAEQLSFLDAYPDVITDREDMKTILKQTGFVSDEIQGPNEQLHFVYFENNECIYDPCSDNGGWSWFMNEPEKGVDLKSFTDIDVTDFPAYYYSYQDTYMWKIDQFERTEYGVSFDLVGKDGYADERHYIFLSEAGYWMYQIVSNGGDYHYMVTEASLKKITQLDDDCPDEGNCDEGY